jgi:glycine betaine transporter
MTADIPATATPDPGGGGGAGSVRVTGKHRATGGHGWVEWLAELESRDEERDLDEVRAEEHQVISANFVLTMLTTVAFIAGALWMGPDVERVAGEISAFLIGKLSWFFILLSALSLIFLGYLAFSRFGNVVLGEPDQPPEFSDLSWYSMLFSAGMGVGLLFNGVSEPISHFYAPPIGEPQSLEAARRALSYTAFHWGLNAWGVYLLCAIGVAYFGFRKKKKYLVSSAILDVTQHPTLRLILKVGADLLATVAVLFGVAGSLAIGTQQITAGLEPAFGIQAQNLTGYAITLGIITVIFIASATTGLDRGVKILSNLNMAVASLLMLFVLFAGPTLFVLKVFVDSIGQYLAELPRLSFQIAPFTPAYEKWMGDWTLLLFAWWIAWSPFVGIFIARISRGRTIRELIVGGLTGPTVFSMLSFAIYGGTALHIELFGSGGISESVAASREGAFFELLARLPGESVTSVITVLLLVTFLVTSADSACFVIAMMTTEGDIEPAASTKVLWGLVLAVVTFLLLKGGGIPAVQAVSLACAFPFSLVMILMAVSVFVRLSVQVEAERL